MKVKNVLLIDIPTYQVKLKKQHREIIRKRLLAQSLLWQLRVGQEMIRPGLTYSRGLLSLAACLESHQFSIKYLNYADPIDRRNIYTIAKQADAIGITVLTPTFGIAHELAEKIKKVNPSGKIILGGPHISARPVASLMDCLAADFAMVGDCEERLPELLFNIEKPEKIAGTSFRAQDGSIQTSTLAISPVNVHDLPLPAYHLLPRPLSDYAHNIRATRGCPYQCNFCYERISWTSSALSRQTIEQTIHELKFLAAQVPPSTLIHFSDAIFNLNWNYTGELVERIKAANFELLFSFDTRVDLVNEEQVSALANAAFVYFRMGFESVLDDILSISAKSITNAKQREASEIIRRVSDKLAIHAYMLTGLPGTTLESLVTDVINIRELVKDDVVDIVGNKVLVPYPGTPYFESAGQHGLRIHTTQWNKYDRRSFPVYSLENLSQDALYLGYLMQEAVLTQTYLEKLESMGILSSELENVTSGLDYLFSNYAQNDEPNF